MNESPLCDGHGLILVPSYTHSTLSLIDKGTSESRRWRSLSAHAPVTAVSLPIKTATFHWLNCDANAERKSRRD